MASPLANLILAEGPRFYYNCDEAAGATLTDQTGNGRNGAVVGSFSRSTALQGAGKGIDLAVGAGNYIQGHHGWSANGIKNAAAGNPGLTIHCLAKFPANYDLATQPNPNFMCAGQTTSGSGAGPIFRILGSQSKWDYLLGLVSDQGTVGATPFPFDGNWHQYVIQIFGQNQTSSCGNGVTMLNTHNPQ